MAKFSGSDMQLSDRGVESYEFLHKIKSKSYCNMSQQVMVQRSYSFSEPTCTLQPIATEALTSHHTICCLLHSPIQWMSPFYWPWRDGSL